MERRSRQPLFRFMVLRRMLPSVLMLMLLVVCFFLILGMTLWHNIRTEHQHQLERIELVVSEIERTLTDIVYDQQAILSSQEFSKFVYLYDDLDWYRRYDLQQRLHRRLLQFRESADYVSSALLYIPALDKTISDARASAALPGWLKPSELADGLVVLDDKVTLTAIRTELDAPQSIAAVFIAVLDEASIVDELSPIRTGEEDDIQLEWIDVPQDDGQATAASGFTRLTVDGQRFALRVHYLLHDDETDVFIQQVTVLCVLFVLLALLIEVIGDLVWYGQVYIPLYQLLIDAFGHAENGDFKFRISIDEKSPFFSVYNSYNRMMEKTEAYVENNLKQQILVSRANLKQLQAQISPHFMYNSYFILYRLIKKGDRESSLRLAEHLGQFYHYVTRNADDEKHLSEEVEHARNYAAIQKFRFRDALDVQIEDPQPEIASVYVPRLILQPLLENAFKYAYESGDGTKTMLLSVHFDVRSPSSFDILVENSGALTEEVLMAIRDKLNCRDEGIETTALVNIHRRLQIYFGQTSALQVGRSSLGGLMVRMHIEDIREEL